jgi:disulfide bond formation protein DsbB
MGYQDRDEPSTQTRREPGPRRFDFALLASLLTNGIVRAAGVALVLVGLWAGVKVVFEAWGLYRDPAAVDRLARVIDRASHVDTLLAPRPGAPAGTGETGARATPAPQSSEEAFKPSYFLAWTLAILMLLLVGKLASWTVHAGGKLALSVGPGRPSG